MGKRGPWVIYSSFDFFRVKKQTVGNPSEGVKKLVSIVLDPFRMALLPELWNAGRHRLNYLSRE